MKRDEPEFETGRIGSLCQKAPDTSQIRPLLRLHRGSLAHCTLPTGATSLAVKHKTIEEIWYFTEGFGQVWRRQQDRDEIVDVSPGVCVTIPTGTHFQFRNTGASPLVFMIATMPPWPGSDEVILVDGFWKTE